MEYTCSLQFCSELISVSRSESTGFTDSASAVLAVVQTTTTRYHDATVVNARFLMWHGGLKRSGYGVELS